MQEQYNELSINCAFVGALYKIQKMYKILALYFLMHSHKVAVYFIPNIQLFLEPLRIYIVSDGVDIDFILKQRLFP